MEAKRIAIIDDEPCILDNLTDLLEGEGYQVLAAADGREGLRLARTGAPDLILCDVRMPHLSGHDVLEALRADARTAAIPFIFLTANSAHTDVRSGMNLGADDFIVKPYASEDLLRAVEARLLRQRALAEQRERALSGLRAQLVSVIPHELRTPLGAILGFSEILRDEWHMLPPEVIREMLGDILASGRRLERFVENYAAYTYLTARAHEAAPAAPAWTPQPEERLAAVAARTAARHARSADLFVDIAPEPLPISEDLSAKLVEELLDNAFKFSPYGSPVRLSVLREGGEAVVEVEDQGRGMQPHEAAQVGAFVQFGRELHEQQGLGLGLAIARLIAHVHGGRLGIGSLGEDRGACVRAAVPYPAEA